MLIGGIQGDEPGSYLTADLYADIHLKKGNLIVVPRANFYSILLSRREGLTGDMNRKFGENGNSKKSLTSNCPKRPVAQPPRGFRLLFPQVD
jgi:predicted deacylase